MDSAPAFGEHPNWWPFGMRMLLSAQATQPLFEEVFLLMKRLFQSITRSRRLRAGPWLAAGVLALGLVAAPAVDATTVTLRDGNSVARIDPMSSAGVFDWEVDGTDQLFQEWFWIRVNGVDNREFGIDTYFSSQATSDVDGNGVDDTLFSTFSRSGYFDASLTHVLTGGMPGSGTSDLAEILRLTNTSNQTLTFSLFEYSDFDLGGTSGDDTGVFPNANLFKQTDGSSGFQVEISSVPSANRREIAPFSDILDDLTDSDIDNLSNSPPLGVPFGPADVTAALQWNITLGAGDSFLLSKNKLVTVPEPASLAMMGLGVGVIGLGVGLRRRSRTA